jgi:hypothetical protein
MSANYMMKQQQQQIETKESEIEHTMKELDPK